MRQLKAWKTAIEGLTLQKLKRVQQALDGAAAQVPFPDQVPPATFALAVVKALALDPRLFEPVGAVVLPTAGDAEGRLAAERWLQEQHWQHRAVPIVGLTGQAFKLPIDDIYVPLHFAGAARHDVLDRRSDALGEVSIEQAFTELQRRRDAGALLAGVSVVGPPGSGKTTLLKRVFARTYGAREETAELGAARTPVLVRVAAVASQIVREAPRCTLQEVLREACGAEEAGDALAAAGPLLVLLDGLEEVADEATRRAVARWLTQEVALHPHSTFVITCRTAAWRRTGDALSAAFLPLTVMGFDRPSIERYIGRWFPLVARTYHPVGADAARALADAEDKGNQLVEALFAKDVRWRLQQLSRNPLMLSVLCLVQYRQGRLPRTRAKLYEAALTILVEEVHRTTGRRLAADDVLAALQPVAWAMHEHGPSAEAADGEDPEDATSLPVQAFVKQLAGRPAGVGVEPDQLVDLLEGNGVLACPDVGQVRFAHLTFQEYLTARYAVASNLEARLARRLDDPWWREVTLLAMAQPGFFARFLEAALPRAPFSTAAQQLLADCREEAGLNAIEACVNAFRRSVRADDTPWTRLLTWVGLEPKISDRSHAALNLTLRCGVDRTMLAEMLQLADDPGVEQVLAAMERAQERTERIGVVGPGSRHHFIVDDLTFEMVWVPPGRFRMGSTEGNGDEQPVHWVTIERGFWLGRFPVTNAQYRAYVAATGAAESPGFRMEGFDAPEQPVVMVSWHDAMGFCRWLSDELLELSVDLPTETEWEWAATSDDGRQYPWGNEPADESRAWFSPTRVGERDHTATVGEHPGGAGPFGAEDQAGNVWEWC
ncbi:MAG: SUMF1/EgtB/PvdO family nonheme iron enzyme, partial [Myxococcales bacterium]|nr:SUMF1/EgtB/PvdO family nonheme iron enzyme [Myxococcales bacterium]